MKNNKKTVLRKTFTAPNGKRYAVTGKTEEELYERIIRKKMEVEQGERRSSGQALTKEWIEEWVETYKVPSVSAGWLGNITSICNSIIVPEIGSMKIQSVRPIDLQRLMNKQEGKSKSYVKKIYNIVQEIFREAYRNRLTQSDPSENLMIPSTAQTEKRRSLTDEERRCILETCGKHRGGLFLKIMLYCGLRPGEVAALKGKHVDLAKAILKVDSSVKKDGSIGAPKSMTGYRKIPIPTVLLPDLEKRIKELDSMEGFICVDTRGNHLRPDSIRKMWISFVHDLNIAMGCSTFRGAIVPPYRVADDLVMYCLRHTYCTDLQAAGVPINVARELMGHSDVSVTSGIYTHSSQESFDAARVSIDGLISERNNLVEATE